MVEVAWSTQSIRDMQSIRSFVSRDSPHYAELLIRRLVAAVDRLRSFPTSGRVVPEFGDASLREVVWRNYRIVYRRVGRQVVILTVFHGSLPFPGTS